jgi:hypothetical protein
LKSSAVLASKLEAGVITNGLIQQQFDDLCSQMIPDVPSRPCIDDHLLKLGPITGIPAWKKNDGLQRFSYLSRYMEGLKQLGSFNTVEASINGELDNPKLSRCRWSGGVSSKWCDANRPLFCWWFGT